MNFMNLPKEYSGNKSKYCILPIEYEGKLTAGKGVKSGSIEIIKESYRLEYYDEQFDNEAFSSGIQLLKPLKFTKKNSDTIVMKKIADEVSKHKDKFMVSIGGDHSVTIGILKGFEKIYPDNNFSVVSFDAHADLFDSWNGSKFNHRCVSKYASYNHDVAIFGLRSLDYEEMQTIRSSQNIHAVFDYDRESRFDVLSKIKHNVYVTIDVDCFDPSFIRATGTPEPGGYSWSSMIKNLKVIFDTKNVIGIDIVEYSPTKDSTAESYSLAKLIYKIISMKEFFG